MKHRKIMCLFQLDTAPGRVAGTGELNSPVDRSVNAVLLPDTRNNCRVSTDMHVFACVIAVG
jgi:hypothetical protein